MQLTHEEINHIYRIASNVYDDMEKRHREKPFECLGNEIRYWNNVYELMYHIENELPLNAGQFKTAMKILNEKTPDDTTLILKCCKMFGKAQLNKYYEKC